ncbi:hypothetical protein Hypma_005398 [Hypsizygus marmoreus]|uniref:Mediator of RNA polymerase II transcription subunit 8 n=1 Tax=Hypsizygus marmoreus TaxID=39966 RepID=A0A369K4N1_HYPMA|nr:hypothetical protein Hypma_005398 [Hypsizygus marmoreus]
MAFPNPSATATVSTPTHLTSSSLPIPQLESLRFKANQIIDSIQALQRTIEAGNQAVMPAWPDILSKYNILLSQTHSFSMGLTVAPPSAGRSLSAGQSSGGPGNLLERIALHPSVGMTDAQLDTDVIPLLRNQQTLDVLRMENETVRRLAEHMATRGSLGVLGGAAPPHPRDMTGSAFGMGTHKATEYEDVLRECEEIRSAHDRRVERAARAVMMLRDKFDWKQRVEVEVEEPEELEWDPRIRQHAVPDESGDNDNEGEGNDQGNEEEDDGDVGMESPDGGSSDEDEVQALVDTAMDTQSPASATLPMPPSNGVLEITPASVTVSDSSPAATDVPSALGS